MLLGTRGKQLQYVLLQVQITISSQTKISIHNAKSCLKADHI